MKWFSKQKKLKDKGVSLCNFAQGYSANNRATSIIEKTKELEMSEDILKTLYQVSVDMSMEEFLMRFFGLWSYDAELLCNILGFQTETKAEIQEDIDEGEDPEYYQLEHQKYIEEKMAGITILNKAKEDYNSLSLEDKFEMFAIQKAFEEGVKELGVEFEDSEINKSEQIESKECLSKNKQLDKNKNSVDKSEGNSEVEKSSGVNNNKNDNKISKDLEVNKSNIENKEEVLDIQEILKSSEAQELLKAMLAEQMAPVQEELNKAKADLEAVEAEKVAIQKAKEEAEKTQFVEVIKGFSFVGEEAEAVELSDALFKSEAKDVVLKAFEKAAAALASVVEIEKGKDFQEQPEHKEINKSSELASRIGELAQAGLLG